MTEQRTRLQAITAKIAHISDANKALREELAYNDAIVSDLLKERLQLCTEASNGVCTEVSTTIANSKEDL